MNAIIRKVLAKLSIEGEAQKVLLRGAGSSFLIKIAGAGLAFGVNILLARLLGVADYGAYVYIYSWVTVLAIPARLGFDNSLIRFIPEYRGGEQWGHLKGILSFAFKSVLFAGVTAALFFTIIAIAYDDFLARYPRELLIVGAWVIPFLAIIQVVKSGLRAFKKVTQSLLPEMVLKHVLIGGATLGLYVAGGYAASAVDAMWATLLAYGAVLGAGGYLLVKQVSEPVKKSGGIKRYKHWLAVTLPMLFITGMYIILKRTDVIMIGSMISEEAAGVYGAVSKISDLAVFGLQAVNVIAAPLIAELYHSDNKKQLQRMVTLATRGAFAVSFVVSVIFILGGHFFLNLFGPAFIAGYLALVILLVAQMANAFSGSVGYLMTLTGCQNAAATILGASAVLNIGLNFWLVPLWGIEGGAVATGISMLAWNIAMIVFVQQKLGIDSTALGRGYNEGHQKNLP